MLVLDDGMIMVFDDGMMMVSEDGMMLVLEDGMMLVLNDGMMLVLDDGIGRWCWSWCHFSHPQSAPAVCTWTNASNHGSQTGNTAGPGSLICTECMMMIVLLMLMPLMLMPQMLMMMIQ